jgi:hypothetical protein
MSVKKFIWKYGLTAIAAFMTAYNKVYEKVRWIVKWHKFKVGDWIFEKHCVAKVLAVGWNTYQLKMITKEGVFIFVAPKKMAEKAYKKIDKKHLQAVLVIYE